MLTASNECEGTPWKEVGLLAGRPKGDGQGLSMAGPSLGMSTEGSANQGPQGSPVHSLPGVCGYSYARPAKVNSCNSVA